MKTTKKSTDKTAVAVTTTSTENVNNTFSFSPEALKIIQSARIDVAKGFSVNVNDYLVRLTNSKFDDVLKNNEWSLDLFSSEEKSKFKTKVWDWYFNYTKTGWQSFSWLKTIGYKRNEFNLGIILEKLEAWKEESFRTEGLIDENNNILKPEEYKKKYQESTIHLLLDQFTEQFKSGNKLFAFKDAGREERKKDNTYINDQREKAKPVEIGNKHVRVTGESIQKMFENALGIKFKENIFALNL